VDGIVEFDTFDDRVPNEDQLELKERVVRLVKAPTFAREDNMVIPVMGSSSAICLSSPSGVIN